TATISAVLPFSMDPSCDDCPNNSAALTVAHLIASRAGIPPSVMYTNSSQFFPCAYTAASVPKAILIPALYAFAKVACNCEPMLNAFGTMMAGKYPGIFAESATDLPAVSVGTHHVPYCLNN